MTDLSHIIAQLSEITRDVRAGIHALDRSGRFGEHVVVTLTLHDETERQYECYARYGYTAKLDQLVAFHRQHNRALAARAARDPLRARKFMDKRVRYVRVNLRGHSFGMETAVVDQMPTWRG